jgi:hypothetical protein
MPSIRARTTLPFLLGVALAALSAPKQPAAAQDRGARPDHDDRPARSNAPPFGAARAVLGMTLSASGTDRDTLGLLVTAVVPDGPADRAGVRTGYRVSEINGVSLRLYPDDVGQRDSGGLAQMRLARALRSVRPGDDLSLRVFGGGRARDVTLRAAETAAPQLGWMRRRASADDSGPVSSGARTEAARAEAARAERRAPTLDGVLETLADAQASLRRLARDEDSDAMRDALTRAAQDLGDVRRRLSDAQDEQRRGAPEREQAPPPRARAERGPLSVSGLRVTPVTDELSTYFGEGSERGFLVLEADSSWDPIQVGDVILRIDGEPVDADRLRAALDARRSEVELLRRRRLITVVMH